MDRRAFLIMALAGVANSASGAELAGPSGDAPPEPAATGGDATFDEWERSFVPRAILAGLSPDVVARELTGVTPDPRIVELDTRQPEFSRPVGDYIQSTVSDSRVAQGRRAMAGVAALPRISTRFGPPAEILVGVWAIESAYGGIQGGFDVIRSLATLASNGRRRDWAEDQLIAALRIIALGEARRSQLKGSWAGAMGQTQIEPTTFLDDAVDGDGDGAIDVWGSSADALATAANLLAKAGWRRGQNWAREVILPSGFDYGLSEGPKQPPRAWRALGIRTADDAGFDAIDAESPAQLLLPAGAAGPAFLAFDNHFVIRQYNNSLAYALAVGLLADRIAGGPPLAAPWPREVPLSLEDRIAAQAALAKLGYPPGSTDGMIGANTRSALRAWQKARGLPADGYLSPEVLRRLTLEGAQTQSPLGSN